MHRIVNGVIGAMVMVALAVAGACLAFLFWADQRTMARKSSPDSYRNMGVL